MRARLLKGLKRAFSAALVALKKERILFVAVVVVVVVVDVASSSGSSSRLTAVEKLSKQKDRINKRSESFVEI